MTHSSPSTFLVWSILSITLLIFLISHIWSYDQFRCLKWSSSGGNGTFKRFMTYTYFLSIPLIVIYSVGFTYIKYTEGYIDSLIYGIIPKPHELWSEGHQAAILPLNLIFSIAWALEIVTHLEELCFWLFLMHSTEPGISWFRSSQFYLWATGSILALGGLPGITLYTKNNFHQCEAWLFLVGSCGSLTITLLSLPILFLFPKFLKKVKSEGVEPAVVVRLTKFHSLNIIRIFFRFIFVIPLMIISIDGVKIKPHINEIMFQTDLLTMMAGFGCVISSSITLLIFFPRSYENEAGYRFRERATIDMVHTEDEKPSFRSSHFPGRHHRQLPSDGPAPARESHSFEQTDCHDDHDHDTRAYRPSWGGSTQVLSETCRDSDIMKVTGYSYSSENELQYTFGKSDVRDGERQQYPHPHCLPIILPPNERKSSMPRPRKGIVHKPIWEMVDIDSERSEVVPRQSSQSDAKRHHQQVVPCPGSNEFPPSTLEAGHTRQESLHPIVINYTSPIDLLR